MKIQIEGVPVYFPYELIYPEQLKYMREIKQMLDNDGHGLFEMPSGLGRTMALLCITVSYQIYMKAKGVRLKIVYCPRTASKVNKTLEELSGLVDYIKKHEHVEFLGLGFSNENDLCTNNAGSENFDINAACRRFVEQFEDSELGFNDSSCGNSEIPAAIYNFSQLRDFGESKGACPYSLLGKVAQICDCMIYTYDYLIDPRIHTIISTKLGQNSIIIFDEAHNIDSHSIEALSIEIKRSVLEGASRAIKIIENNLRMCTDSELHVEHEKMKKKLFKPTAGTIPYFYAMKEGAHEFIPGNLRNSFHVISALRRITEFLKTKLKTVHLVTETTDSFCKGIKELAFVERKTLRFCSQRLGLLYQSLLQMDDEDMMHLRVVADFSTMIAIGSRGFEVIFEPFNSKVQDGSNPIIRLMCLDSSIAMAPIFSKFRNVIITSEILSPIGMYPKILNFVPLRAIEIGRILGRNSISPLIITKGNDQMVLRASDGDGDANHEKDASMARFSLKSNPSIVRNYGHLLVELSRTVPDGIVCFFPSYSYMEEIVGFWAETNVISELSRNKLVFVETFDCRETELALSNYRKSCRCGRGGMLFSVARGKIAESVDFEDEYGRCVVVLGVPFQCVDDVGIKKRLEFLREEYGTGEFDFLVLDAMRHTAQCLCRTLKGKSDYCLMILADEKFGKHDEREKLPKWIRSSIDEENCNLSVDMALSVARKFYREMAQECTRIERYLLKEDDIKNFSF